MKLVIVGRYSYAQEAHIFRASLESAGIPAFISDEHMIQADWLYSNLLGGVKLWVAQEDVQKAQQVLDADYSEALENMLEVQEIENTLPTSDIDAYSPTQKRKYAVMFFLFVYIGGPAIFIEICLRIFFGMSLF